MYITRATWSEHNNVDLTLNYVTLETRRCVCGHQLYIREERQCLHLFIEGAGTTYLLQCSQSGPALCVCVGILAGFPSINGPMFHEAGIWWQVR